MVSLRMFTVFGSEEAG